MKILFISLSAPPAVGSHTTRVYALIRGFNRSGSEVHCLTGTYSDFDKLRSGLTEDFESMCKQVRRVSRGAVSGRVSATYKTGKPAGKIKTALRNFARRFAVPDTFVEWIRPAYRVASEMQEHGGDFDLVVSSGAPFSAHIVGALFSRRFKVPLVLDYGDPWVLEPGRPRGLVRFYFESLLEKFVLRASRLVTVTTPETKKLYEENFGGIVKKVGVVFMGYDSSEFESFRLDALRRPLNQELTVVYAGRVNTEYRDLSLLGAYLSSTTNPGRIRAKFKFYSQERSEISRFLGEGGGVEILDAVPHAEFISIIARADANLLLGNKSDLQIPGKVFQYIGAMRPIIYIPALLSGEPDPTLNLLLETCPSYTRVVRSQDDLDRALSEVSLGALTPSPQDMERALMFDWQAQSSEFVRMCEGAAGF